MGSPWPPEIQRALDESAQLDVDYAQRCLDEIHRLATEKGPGGKRRLQKIYFLCERVINGTPRNLHGRFWVIIRKADERLKALANA